MQRTLLASCAIFSAIALSAAHAQVTRVSVASGAWSNSALWNPPGVPAADDDVVISQTTTITIATTTPNLGQVHIKGSLTNAANSNLELRANRIEVLSGGLLQIGTQTVRYLGNARVALLDTANGAGYETASLIVHPQGTIELHGEDRGLPWTTLSQSTPALPNDTSTTTPGFALLNTAVTWRKGDSVALVSNDFYRPYTTLPDPTVAEFVLPTSFTVGGTRMNFPESLQRQHFAALDRGVSMFAEVALMNRNIVVAGNGGDNRGHVMFRGTSQNTTTPSGPVVHISWTRFENLGKNGQLGRYPVHFHLNGDAPSAGRNSVRNCVVAHSQNRSYVIHGTNDVDLVGNIAYDIVGHSFYLEDGTETGNLIEGNLGFGTRAG
ncbi:MAG: G8 domain-containing protein, partial [Planctomycetes bacterium]|nr:G8 domain-containing protein [Planctomycetota bacterium]